MRLLKRKENGDFCLTEFVGDNIPPYAILSHTWGADDEEVTFKDLVEGTGQSKAGPGWLYKDPFLRKASGYGRAELSEAINSIFRWYHNAPKCYVYLSDVSISGSNGSDLFSQRTLQGALQKSRWFTRGGTLQELVAPMSVERRGNRKSLELQIHEITGIAVQALQGTPLSHFTVNERMSWVARRKTKREEDAAYCLLGIFDIYMPLIYEEVFT